MTHKKYSRLALGGTFDHLHLGHQHFLAAAFNLADNVDIAITKSESLLKDKKFSQQIQFYNTRKTSLISYLKAENYYQRSRIFELNDIYGNTLKEAAAQAILVTPNTEKNAVLINEQRQKQGFKKLDIIVTEFQKDNKEQIISSERIRLGEIDRAGFNYFDLFNKEVLIFPEKLRYVLRIPLGETFPTLPDVEKNNHPMLISVGDIVSQSLINKGITPDVRIIDYRSRRQFITNTSKKKLTLINAPGTLSFKAAELIKNVIQKNIKDGKKHLIEINGEEDLLVLPSIILAPLGALVFYGQFDIGVVQVEITEAVKKNVKKILELFI